MKDVHVVIVERTVDKGAIAQYEAVIMVGGVEYHGLGADPAWALYMAAREWTRLKTPKPAEPGSAIERSAPGPDW